MNAHRALIGCLAIICASATAGIVTQSGPRYFGGVPGGGGGDVPAYISTMSTYQVRALTGAYAPSGAETIEDAIAALGDPLDDWLTSDPSAGDIRAVISRWSGGDGDPSGHRLLVLGGGHNDSAFNGVISFDYTGSTPLGWVVEVGSLSPVSQVPTADGVHNTYNDGKAGSVHTYDGVNYDATGDRLYRMGGAAYKQGDFTSDTFYYDFATNAWVQETSWPTSTEVPLSVMDQTARKIFITRRNATVAYFYDVSDDTWSSARDLAVQPTTDAYPMMALDTSRDRAWMIAGNGQCRLYSLNWSAETFTEASCSPSGDTDVLDSSQGITILYDEARDSFWVFGGDDVDGQYDAITECDADTFACTEHALTGDAFEFNETGNNYNGSYGRAVLMPDYRAIGFATSTSHPAYVIKLP